MEPSQASKIASSSSSIFVASSHMTTKTKLATTGTPASSLTYAERLKKGHYRGPCNLKEKKESDASIQQKSLELAQIIRKGQGRVVVHTGAGISTSCGIPDFRGANGVWTREARRLPPPSGVTFEDARPSFTHMALAALMREGFVWYIVSQNVDGLHLRSGVPRDKLSELHGNVFMEKCQGCNTHFFGDREVQTVGFKPTGNICSICGGRLVDQCLDWDDALPEYDLSMAEEFSKKATLSLCLGSSLRMKPAMNLPVMSTRRYGKQECGQMAICNFSTTPMDHHAILNIRAPCDHVMRVVCDELKVEVPDYNPTALLTRTFTCELEDKKGDTKSKEKTTTSTARKKKNSHQQHQHQHQHQFNTRARARSISGNSNTETDNNNDDSKTFITLSSGSSSSSSPSSPSRDETTTTTTTKNSTSSATRREKEDINCSSGNDDFDSDANTATTTTTSDNNSDNSSTPLILESEMGLRKRKRVSF